MPTPSSTSRACLVLIAMLCLVTAGCGQNKVTRENFAKITPGMTEIEVTNILGKPSVVQEAGGPSFGGLAGGPGGMQGGGMKQMMWQNGNKSITVQFLNGTVAAKMSEGL